MARKNRKRRAQANVLPVPFIGVLSILGLLGIGYLWMETLCSSLSQQIRRLEEDHKRLVAERQREESRWAVMKAPQEIERALQRHGLHMVLPQGEQVVRLSQPDTGGAHRPAGQLASR